jgi:tetratricopeptide (TPR) repeat protein
MRILAILGGIVLVLLVCLGAAAWWVTEPMRFAGIERDPARAVTGGELPEPERPGITRREIVDLLRNREFDVLTRIIETRNQRALADPKEEWEFVRVIDAFEIRDDSLADEFDDWIQASPNSFAPLLASAQHRFVLAFLERGTRYARETTREQFEAMSMQIDLMREDLDAAFRNEPRVSEIYALMIDAARANGSQAECGNAAKAGLEVMPASLRIRTALASCRLPRWGGRYSQVDAIAEAAEPFMVDNPELAALHGYVDWDKARDTEGAPAIRHLDAALTAGAYWLFYRDRADEYRRAKRFKESLEDVDAAIELAPDDPDLLVDRMYALLPLGRNDEIPGIIELVEAIDPMNTSLPGFKKYALQSATVDAYDLQKNSDNASSIERLNEAIAIDGGDAQAYYFRGRGYIKSGDHPNALADFETAIRLDPDYFEAYQNIDYIYAMRGEWAGVIGMWDAYIDKHPEDARAVFERAGSYRHSGDEIRAMQEAKKACDMGHSPACAAIRRR